MFKKSTAVAVSLLTVALSLTGEATASAASESSRSWQHVAPSIVAFDAAIPTEWIVALVLSLQIGVGLLAARFALNHRPAGQHRAP